MNRKRSPDGKFSGDPLLPGGFHNCNLCGTKKEADEKNFRVINKGKTCESLSKTCRKCEYQKGKDKHARNMKNPDFAETRRKRCRDWRNNNRSKVALKNYQSIDKKKGLTCTMTIDDVEELQSMQCHYCGDTERVGADRINNSLAHTRDNCLPCCPDCNICRSNTFSVDEMMVIGSAIRLVKKSRNSTNC